MPTKYVTVDGTPLHYFHTGRTTLPGVTPDLARGELLLFVHGAGSNAHTWHHQLAAFADRHSPVAFDFPGHGRSGGTESLHSIDAYLSCLCGFMEHTGSRPAVLVGRSMGGAVALACARAQPQRVRALVLVATAARFALPPPMLDTWRDVMRGRIPQPFTREMVSPAADMATVRELWMEQVKTDPRVRYHDLCACNDFDARPWIGELRVPTLVVAGRDDTITPVARSEELHIGIGDSRLVVIDEAGHSVPGERPAEFNAALSEFLDGLT
jgi:3-oxoadipate enol-lactonase